MRRRRRVARFRFENACLHDGECEGIVQSSWVGSMGHLISFRIRDYGMALGDWVKSPTRLFKSRVFAAKDKMAHHRGKSDRENLRAFEVARGQYINLLNQRETFWTTCQVVLARRRRLEYSIFSFHGNYETEEKSYFSNQRSCWEMERFGTWVG